MCPFGQDVDGIQIEGEQGTEFLEVVRFPTDDQQKSAQLRYRNSCSLFPSDRWRAVFNPKSMVFDHDWLTS